MTKRHVLISNRCATEKLVLKHLQAEVEAERIVHGTSAPNMHSILGFGFAEEKRHAWNDTHHYSDTTADRRAAELGLFKRMGLLSGRNTAIFVV